MWCCGFVVFLSVSFALTTTRAMPVSNTVILNGFIEPVQSSLVHSCPETDTFLGELIDKNGFPPTVTVTYVRCPFRIGCAGTGCVSSSIDCDVPTGSCFSIVVKSVLVGGRRASAPRPPLSSIMIAPSMFLPSVQFPAALPAPRVLLFLRSRPQKISVSVGRVADTHGG